MKVLMMKINFQQKQNSLTLQINGRKINENKITNFNQQNGQQKNIKIKKIRAIMKSSVNL